MNVAQNNNWKVSKLAIALSLCLASGAFAQQTPAAKAIEAKAGLEEVVVTAERRKANIQTVPIAINSVSGEQLAAAGKVTIDSALLAVPSVQLRASGKGAYITIRGLGGSQDPSSGSPGVSLSKDGVYQQQSATVKGSLYDINRIEVLKGPQGMLYGRNSIAGSVNVISNDPSDKFEGKVGIQVGNYKATRFEGMLNVPVNDVVAIRGSALSNKHDPYLANGYNNQDDSAGRLKVAIKPTQDLKIILSGEAQKWHGVNSDVLPDHGIVGANATNQRSWTGGYPYNIESVVIAPGTAAFPTKGYADNTASDFHAQVDWTSSIGTLTYLGAATDFHLDLGQRQGGDWSTTLTNEKQTSHEVRLASLPGATAEWVIGAYYLTANMTQAVAVDGNASFVSGKTSTNAAFGQITYPVNDTWSLIGGLRKTNDKTSQARVTANGALNPQLSSSSNDYKLGVQAKLSADSLVYLTTSTAYKGASFTQVDTMQPEHVKSWELGTKNRFFDKKLQINAALFYSQYKNYQATSIALYTFPNGVTSATSRGFNVTGDTPIKGAELEAKYKLTPNDRIDFSVTLLSAKFGTFVTATRTGTADFSGNRLPNVPERQAVLGYEHLWDMVSGASVSAGATARVQSNTFVHFNNVPSSYQSGYGMLDLNLNYTSADGKWNIGAFVKNATNKAVQTSLTTAGIWSVGVSDPRTYGVSLSSSF